MRSRIVWVSVTAVFIGACAATEVLACECAGTPKACETFWQTDAVFTGTVRSLSIFSVERGEGSFKYKVEQVSVRLQIADLFRGELVGPEVEVITGMGGGDCGYHFERDKQYLVYASKFENQLHTGICARTRLLSDAADDLKYFYNLPTTGSGSTIAGSIRRYVVPVEDDSRSQINPMPSVKVTVDGGGKHLEAETDQAGQYEFRGLEPGTYKVKAALPTNSRNYSESEVTVVDRGCAYRDFVSHPGVNLTGKVVDADGKAGAGLKVDLINANEAGAAAPKGKWRFTSLDGRYTLDSVPAGEYLLGINLINSRDPQCPPRTYFPGVADFSGATVVTVKEGQDLNELNIKLPPAAADVEIEGTVVWPNGTPAVRAAISLTNGIMNQQKGVDGNGHFVLKGIEGCTYQILAFTYGGRISATSDVVEEQRHAEPVTLTLTREKRQPLKLVLASPGFQHREDEPRTPR